MCFVLVGCGKMSSEDAIEKFKNNINKDYYTMSGQMDIVSNEELYHYDVKVTRMDDDFYKASLINKDTKELNDLIFCSITKEEWK